jgi:hypothetical protein
MTVPAAPPLCLDQTDIVNAPELDVIGGAASDWM